MFPNFREVVMYTNIHLARRVIDICHSLMEFREPRVGVTAFDAEDTRLAQCDPVKGILVLRDKYPSETDLIFAVAHECRHLHQYAAGGLNERLKVRPKTDNKVDYNLRPEEVDANAFGSIIVQELCGVRPLWNGLPQEVKDAITVREKQIVLELKRSTH